MSTPPSMGRPRSKAADAPEASATADDSATKTVKREPLSKRLTGMSDYKLRAYHSSAIRISGDTTHPKNLAAKTALPLILHEMARRNAKPSPAKADKTGG